MRIRRYLIWSVSGILGLTLLATATLYWASRSETLLGWGVDRIAASLPCTLLVEGLQGAFMEPLAVDYIVCENADFRVEARKLSLVWSPLLLITRGQIEVLSLRAGMVSLMSKSTSSEPLTVPQDISVPVAIDVKQIEIGSILVGKGDNTTEVNQLSASYSGDKRSHHLTVHHITSEWGQARLDVTIGASASLPVSAQIHIDSDYVETWPVNADIQLTGELQQLSAHLQVNAGTLPLSGVVVLAPFDPAPVVSIVANVADIDVADFAPGLPHTTLSAEIQARVVDGSTLTGTLHAENSEPGTLDKQRLPVRVMDTNFELDTNSLRLPMVRVDLGPAGQISGNL